MSRLVMLRNARQVTGFLTLSVFRRLPILPKSLRVSQPAQSLPLRLAGGLPHGQKARKQIIWQQFRGLMQQFSRLARKQGYRIRPFGIPVTAVSGGS
jgi:hypothetical protein